jgi:glycosyltransferase involved in cell wall biosynthesis
VPLYERLRTLLADRRVDLVLLVGEGTPDERAKRDGGNLSWATIIPTRYYLSGNVCWQPFGRYLRNADLVVISHQNKLLYNHWLLRASRPWKLALWGHGRNMQTDRPGGMRERFKRWTISKADWYFAYTRISVEVVAKTGFPSARISNLNNTIDVSALARDRDSVSKEEVALLKKKLAIAGAPVGVFIGSLYAEKRLPFLFQACCRIRQHLPQFQCLVIGDGLERARVQEWALANSWMHWVGARQGRDKALHLGCADVMLNPGMVGLGILDSFVFGIPLITTDCGIHSPEIAYLRSGDNGLMTQDEVRAFADAASSLLSDPIAVLRMSRACLNSAASYSIDGMATRFADGMVSALASPRLT